MIKKTYITPCMDCLDVQTGTTLLAGSITSVDVISEDYNPENMIDLARECENLPNVFFDE